MTKVVSCLSKTKNGVIATAKQDRFYVELISDGVSIKNDNIKVTKKGNIKITNIGYFFDRKNYFDILLYERKEHIKWKKN